MLIETLSIDDGNGNGEDFEGKPKCHIAHVWREISRRSAPGPDVRKLRLTLPENVSSISHTLPPFRPEKMIFLTSLGT